MPSPVNKKFKKRPHKRGYKSQQKQESNSTPQIIAFNKPFNTLCQFSGEPGDSTLSDFIPIKNVYPAGRLDKDSEGLLILTNDGKLQHKISHPKFNKSKTYWVQVEGDISLEALDLLSRGVKLKDGLTRPAQAKKLNSEHCESQLWERQPPVRFRQNIPTSWIELTIKEGKNRQVRRMTAAVDFPTLRLIRMSIGNSHIEKLQPGEFRQLTEI